MTMGDRICIMNEGKVVQIGRPLEVYRNPADTFVARFLGNPPMNLLRGRLEASDGAVFANLGGVRMPMPHAGGGSLARLQGRDVTFGIRPEDFYEFAPPAAAANMAHVPVQVNVVEPLGAETLLVVTLDGGAEEIIARIGRTTELRSGDRLNLAVDTTAIHVFDPDTTKAVDIGHR
jgi:ABC-type sugar transport system ATPase subunit